MKEHTEDNKQKEQGACRPACLVCGGELIEIRAVPGAVCRSGLGRAVSSVDCGVASAAITGRQDDRLRRSPCFMANSPVRRGANPLHALCFVHVFV
jgi:hypothetical protein